LISKYLFDGRGSDGMYSLLKELPHFRFHDFLSARPNMRHIIPFFLIRHNKNGETYSFFFKIQIKIPKGKLGTKLDVFLDRSLSKSYSNDCPMNAPMHSVNRSIWKKFFVKSILVSFSFALFLIFLCVFDSFLNGFYRQKDICITIRWIFRLERINYA
jgi:hypothetical protein